MDTETFIRNSCIQYETTFDVPVSIYQWNRILDNICLMGKLWDLYGFQPRYSVAIKGAGFHIVDPTGIEADLTEVSLNPVRRVYYGYGRIRNWGLPLVISGKALFCVDSAPSAGSVTVRLGIYGEGSGSAVDLVIKAVSPVLKLFIARRIKSNVRDMNIIIADIVRNPAKIQKSLSGNLADDFKRLTSSAQAYGTNPAVAR